MASSDVFLLLLVFVSIVAFKFTMAVGGESSFLTDKKVCSIERNGTLTMFNGESADVELPCKYRLADFTCGDYRVKVTPGSAVDKDYSHRFSPDTVRVKVVNANTSQYVKIRTSVKRLDKLSKGKISNPWQVKEGSVSVVDFADYDQSQAAAVLRKDGVFSVEFSSAERSVVVRCFDDEFVSKGLPEALCGDGTTTDAIKKATTTLFPGQDDVTDDALVSYVVLNHDSVVQSSTCKDMASKFQSCEDKEKAAMECVAIFGDPSQAECLATSDTPLMDYYADCLTSVCDDDTSAVEPMNNYITDNCELQQDLICNTSAWLKSHCKTNEDCGIASHVECFKDWCVCSPGFFYSESSRCCVENCSQLSSTFDYRNAVLYFNTSVKPVAPLVADVVFTEFYLLRDCFDPCASNSSCLFTTLNYNVKPHTCSMHSDLAFTDGEGSSYQGVYKKWCV